MLNKSPVNLGGPDLREHTYQSTIDNADSLTIASNAVTVLQYDAAFPPRHESEGRSGCGYTALQPCQALGVEKKDLTNMPKFRWKSTYKRGSTSFCVIVGYRPAEGTGFHTMFCVEIFHMEILPPDAFT
jgi:hypothetical protein